MHQALPLGASAIFFSHVLHVINHSRSLDTPKRVIKAAREGDMFVDYFSLCKYSLTEEFHLLLKNFVQRSLCMSSSLNHVIIVVKPFLRSFDLFPMFLPT